MPTRSRPKSTQRAQHRTVRAAEWLWPLTRCCASPALKACRWRRRSPWLNASRNASGARHCATDSAHCRSAACAPAWLASCARQPASSSRSTCTSCASTSCKQYTHTHTHTRTHTRGEHGMCEWQLLAEQGHAL